MPYRTLIGSEELSHHLGDAAWAIVDCRFKLDDPSCGARDYEAGHIPGAVYADLDRDLAGEKTGANGRHPLPEPAAFIRTLNRLGIDDSVQVVAYDQDVGMYASRLWWMLRWMGHERVAVLDGGFARWLSEGCPTASGDETRRARQFTGRPHDEMVASVQDVAAMVGRPEGRLLDARAPERFSGATETIDKKAGHIPSAANHFFRWNVDDQSRMRAPEEVRARFEQTLAGIPPSRVVCYCGSGVTACQNLLAMEHVGLSGAKLYPGSWSEWSSDPEREVATD